MNPQQRRDERSSLGAIVASLFLIPALVAASANSPMATIVTCVICQLVAIFAIALMVPDE